MKADRHIISKRCMVEYIPSEDSDICYYHTTYGDQARKC